MKTFKITVYFKSNSLNPVVFMRKASEKYEEDLRSIECDVQTSKYMKAEDGFYYALSEAIRFKVEEFEPIHTPRLKPEISEEDLAILNKVYGEPGKVSFGPDGDSVYNSRKPYQDLDDLFDNSDEGMGDH